MVILSEELSTQQPCLLKTIWNWLKVALLEMIHHGKKCDFAQQLTAWLYQVAEQKGTVSQAAGTELMEEHNGRTKWCQKLSWNGVCWGSRRGSKRKNTHLCGGPNCIELLSYFLFFFSGTWILSSIGTELLYWDKVSKWSCLKRWTVWSLSNCLLEPHTRVKEGRERLSAQAKADSLP